jgi:hypothetical protein
MNLKLKIAILSLYGNQSRFALECGKTDNWISRIVTGRKRPNHKEKELIRAKLKIENLNDYLSGCDAQGSNGKRE